LANLVLDIICIDRNTLGRSAASFATQNDTSQRSNCRKRIQHRIVPPGVTALDDIRNARNIALSVLILYLTISKGSDGQNLTYPMRNLPPLNDELRSTVHADHRHFWIPKELFSNHRQSSCQSHTIEPLTNLD
jgi:hypothetical protein